ncbi:hypothetical protein [Prosthecobacter sp.]|uniref:hypothetical protein n=1 Tax=Prosthecobacter sp. TaxID=1965333 RepID=UPI0037841EED
MIGPFPLEEFAPVAAAALLLPPLVVWLVMRGKLKRLQAESAATLDRQRSEAEAVLQAERAEASKVAAEARKASVEAAASFTDLQQRFNTHREVSERRSNDASQQITRLEAELASTREIAAQLVPTQSRIKDLETALAAEQGRVKAQEQAIEATNARAADFEKRMLEAKDMVLKQKMEMQDTAFELKKIRDEQAAYAAAGGPEAELAKAREATHQAETKVANLQRALKAAEARTEMVQKEFMNAVGLATAPSPGAPAATSDKKLRDMEEKLTHVEADSRKRAREDGYKIAELEYRLSEALEAAKTAKAALAKPEPEPAPEPPAPTPEVAPAPAPEFVAETAPPAAPEQPPTEPVVAAPTAEQAPQERPEEEAVVSALPEGPVETVAAVAEPSEPAPPAEAPAIFAPLPQVAEAPAPPVLREEPAVTGTPELPLLS